MLDKMLRPISALFVVAALYDGILGVLFLTAPGAIFHAFDVAPPNHPAYVQFPAALLIVFALIFVCVAREPIANRSLIIYGMLLKVSFFGLAFWYWFSAGIPGFWKPFAVIDFVMCGLFAWSYSVLGARAVGATPAQSSSPR
jgi:hypothetical protein